MGDVWACAVTSSSPNQQHKKWDNFDLERAENYCKRFVWCVCVLRSLAGAMRNQILRRTWCQSYVLLIGNKKNWTFWIGAVVNNGRVPILFLLLLTIVTISLRNENKVNDSEQPPLKHLWQNSVWLSWLLGCVWLGPRTDCGTGGYVSATTPRCCDILMWEKASSHEWADKGRIYNSI